MDGRRLGSYPISSQGELMIIIIISSHEPLGSQGELIG